MELLYSDIKDRNFSWEYYGTLFWNGKEFKPQFIDERAELYEVIIPLPLGKSNHIVFIDGYSNLLEKRPNSRFNLLYVKSYLDRYRTSYTPHTTNKINTIVGYHEIYLETCELTILKYRTNEIIL